MKSSKAFTVTELLVVVIILIVLAAILFPVVTDSHHGNYRGSCMSNLKQIGLAMVQYEQDNDEKLPPRQYVDEHGHLQSWRAGLSPYTKSTGVYKCPTSTVASWPDIEQDGYARSYAVNSSTGGANDIGGPFSDSHPFLLLKKITAPSTTIAVVESTAAFNDFNPLFPQAFAQPTRKGYRTGHQYCGHDGMTNVGFVDGHAKAIKPMQTMTIGQFSIGGGTNGWTIDGSPYSPTDLATATSTIAYGASMSKSDSN